MKQKNLMIYILFIIVIILVPNEVRAEYESKTICNGNKENGFWIFDKCIIESSSGQSLNFLFNELNSDVVFGTEKVTYKENKKVICASRKGQTGENGVIDGYTCDVYYIQKNYNASCVYQSDEGTVVKILVNTSNEDVFRAEVQVGGTFKKVFENSLKFETFPYDGECPTTMKAIVVPSEDRGYEDAEFVCGTGDVFKNIKGSSTNEVSNPACTDKQKETFVEKEKKLFEEWEELKNSYVAKIKSKQFGQYTTTADQRISDLEAKVTVPISNYDKVYQKKLDKLSEEYSCDGLPEIDHTDDVDFSELETAMRQTIEDLKEQAIISGDMESAKVYTEYLENEFDEFISGKEEDFKYIIETISVNWNFGENIRKDCEDLLGKNLLGHIQQVFDWIKIIAPILLILFGSLDFGKAVLANDNDGIKKATSNFIKRAIATVAIFFLPFIIELIFKLPGIKEELGVSNNPLCNINWVVKK